MPPKKKSPKLELEQKDNGSWALEGLSPRQFSKALQLIEKQKAKQRRKAKRTITPSVLRSRNLEEIKRLGARPDGQLFTQEDVKRMDRLRTSFQKRFNNREQGITFTEIMALSSDERRDRATNRVDDGSGITSASIVSGKDNTIQYWVRASDKNGADAHFVKVRYEEWDEWMYRASEDSKFDYKKAVRKAVAGKVSFDCTCEDHQYRYRYMATVGNYALAPPKEHSYPKIQNPSLEGLACKHVLHVLHKNTTPTFVSLIANKFMRPQGTKIGGGSLRKVTLKDNEFKKGQKAKKTSEIDAQKYQKEHQKYLDRQSNLAKKLAKEGATIDQIRKNASKARKVAEAALKMADRADARAKQAEKRAQRAEAKQAQTIAVNKDMARLGLSLYRDANQGISEKQARAGFAKQVGISEKELGELLSE